MEADYGWDRWRAYDILTHVARTSMGYYGLGTMAGVCSIGPCREGHLQAFWPECNTLIGRRYDPVSGEPDYNAFVTVERGAATQPRVL